MILLGGRDPSDVTDNVQSIESDRDQVSKKNVQNSLNQQHH